MACSEIEDFCKGVSYADFTKSPLLQAGVERKIEIVGEAFNRLYQVDPEWLEQTIPEYPRIISVRNIIAHGYDIVDYDVLWDIAQNHVPGLRKRLEAE